MLLLADPPPGTLWLGRVGAGLAFVLAGAGIQITQTAGMALASDLATPETRPRVVAFLYTALLVGLLVGAAGLGWMLAEFSPKRLIQVVQGCAVAVMVLNLTALWRQEARGTRRGARWRALMAMPGMRRFLWTVGLGTCAFSMQDIVLEPYGGEVLGLAVGHTSALTALSAMGAMLAFAWSAHQVARGTDTCRWANDGECDDPRRPEPVMLAP
ncbi:MAG: MFS transporter, partial [Burkholderiaceae bacterium]